MDEREMPGDEESAAYRAWAAQEDAYEAWAEPEIAAGRLDERVPEEREIEGPAISLSLGDATGIEACARSTPRRPMRSWRRPPPGSGRRRWPAAPPPWR